MARLKTQPLGSLGFMVSWAKKSKLSIAVAVIAVLGACATIFGWAAASPSGASPDDDFHQTSIWCPAPVDQTCSETTDANGSVEVAVPAEVAQASACYAFEPDTSAACVSAIPDTTVESARVNIGLYPNGYYSVMHLLVGPDVYTSIVIMRLVNGGLLLALLGVIAFFLPHSGRRLLAYSTLPVCVPLLVYLVCSINPSGWAVSGLIITWFGTYASIMATTRVRMIIPGVVALMGAGMAVSARTDAGAYLCVLSLASVILFSAELHRRLWHVALPALTLICGVIGFFSGNQTHALSDGLNPDASGHGTSAILINNILNIPRMLIDYSAGFMGLNWLDTVMPPLVWVTVSVLSLAVLFLGLRKFDWRKLLALSGLGFTYVALPLWLLQVSGNNVGANVQTRYIAPLVSIIFAVALWRPKQGGAPRLSLAQTTILYLGIVGAQAIALNTQIRRFISGVDVTTLNLNYQVEWWHAGPSPMATWLIGSLGFAALSLVLFLVRREKKPTTTESDREKTPLALNAEIRGNDEITTSMVSAESGAGLPRSLFTEASG